MNDPDFRRELRGYLTGYLVAIGLTVVPFAVILWGQLSFSANLIVLGICAVAQFVVQLRYFLHIDLSRQKREDLQLILFTFLLLSIMAGGTIWIVGNLATRM